MTRTSLAVAMLLLVAVGSAHALKLSVAPEIDPASGTAALGLLSGGFLILYRRKKK